MNLMGRKETWETIDFIFIIKYIIDWNNILFKINLALGPQVSRLLTVIVTFMMDECQC